MSNNKEKIEKLLQLMHETVQQDAALRTKLNVGDKFRFIRDRLVALVARIEENLALLQQEAEQKQEALAEDEALIFVHLFNAHGLMVQTWQKMVHPSVFYEYSVNRPIYSEKIHIESFIRAKTNKVQHAFLTIAVKKHDIVSIASEAMKDPIGHPLIKVREGSLKPNRLLLFTHNGLDYEVNQSGLLVKKM